MGVTLKSERGESSRRSYVYSESQTQMTLQRMIDTAVCIELSKLAH